MNRRPAATRLLVASLVLLLLFLGLALAAYLGGRGVERESDLIRDDAVPGSINAHAMEAALINCMSEEVLAAVTTAEGSRAEHLERAAKADTVFREEFARYKATMHINPRRDQELMAQLADRYANFSRQREAFEGTLRQGDRAARLAFLESELAPAYAAVSEVMDDVVAYNHANALDYANAISDSVRLLRWIIVIVLLLALVCGIVLATNLAVRRREERERWENERRLRRVLDNLHAFVAVLELDGTIVEVNRAPLEVAGLKREDVIGQPFAGSPWWTHSPEAQARLREVLQAGVAGKTSRYDVEIRAAGGRRLPIDFGCAPLRDSEGRVTQLVVTAIDISERKKLEEQVLRAQRMEAIGTLSSGLAHDLNNILAPMLMAAGLLKVKLTAPRDHRIVEMIESGAQRGADIIRQLLTFGRGSDGEKSEVQVRHLLRDMANIIRETFPRNLELEHQAPSDLWPVVADATQLHQVLLNFCVNARDAMPGGGKLTLHAANLQLGAESARIHLQARAGPYVVLTVADTGDGIPPEIINRIFDPFFTTKPVGKGTGLGLSSTLGIVKGHGGFLTVDSEPGKGTTFRAYLPAAQGAPAAEPAGAADQLPRGHGEMVLLVDDEEAMREATREVLETHNYRVIIAANGEEAVRQFVEHRDTVKLVLTDLDMPVMGGAELIRSLRVLESGLHFLPMTGSSAGERLEELAALGVSEVMRKPCDPAALLRRLRQLFEAPPAPR